jgi:hypothetical protein
MRQFLYFSMSGIFLFAACKPQNVSQAETQYVLGKDNRILIDKSKRNQLPKDYWPLVDAVGIFKKPDKSKPGGDSGPFCSGFHIGGGVVVTAGHCVMGKHQPGKTLVIENSTLSMENTSFIDFNDYIGGIIHRSQVTKVIYAINTRHLTIHDFAFLEVKPPPLAAIKLAQGARPPVGSKVSLISGGGDSSLMWSQFCVIRKSLSPLVMPQSFWYTCDNERGSSGGPIILDSDKTALGINYKQGAHDYGPAEPGVSSEDLQNIGPNSAVYVDRILEFLPQKYKDVILK